MSALALRPEPDDGRREAVLWAASLALALAAHLALGLHLLARSPASPVAGDPLPAVEIDMAPPSSAPSQSSRASEFVPTSAAPDPVVEEVPDVPEANIPPPEPLAREMTVEPAPELPDAVVPQPAVPPPTVVPPNPAVALPLNLAPPAAKTAARRPDRKAAERTSARPVQAETRGARQVERRPASLASGSASNATLSASSGASAASSAAWRSQLVAYLQGRLRYPPGSVSTGSAGVSFLVSRSGGIVSASLVRSSGNPTLDAAAMAVFRGSVPPPPAGYDGSLSFSIPIRFNQR
ncbi:cell envelope integrity protein TolA [uncultured Enterovirga sp.]|uniref:cell envelope integrity protein TolA n=1 Tax=uncultured Enterovirga sp. TaxID=2026352 RepID=UPI0035CC759B